MVGTVAGVLMWFAVTPRFETAAGHRIDWLDLPWWQIAAAVLLAVLTSTGARGGRRAPLPGYR